MEVLFFIDLILLLSYTWALSGFLWLTLFSLFLPHYGIVLQDKNIQNIRLNLVDEARLDILFYRQTCKLKYRSRGCES